MHTVMPDYSVTALPAGTIKPTVLILLIARYNGLNKDEDKHPHHYGRQPRLSLAAQF